MEYSASSSKLDHGRNVVTYRTPDSVKRDFPGDSDTNLTVHRPI